MTFSELLKIIESVPKSAYICSHVQGRPIGRADSCSNCCMMKMVKTAGFCHDNKMNVRPAILEEIKIEVRKEKLERLLSQ